MTTVLSNSCARKCILLCSTALLLTGVNATHAAAQCFDQSEAYANFMDIWINEGYTIEVTDFVVYEIEATASEFEYVESVGNSQSCCHCDWADVNLYCANVTFTVGSVDQPCIFSTDFCGSSWWTTPRKEAFRDTVMNTPGLCYAHSATCTGGCWGNSYTFTSSSYAGNHAKAPSQCTIITPQLNLSLDIVEYTKGIAVNYAEAYDGAPIEPNFVQSYVEYFEEGWGRSVHPGWTANDGVAFIETICDSSANNGACANFIPNDPFNSSCPGSGSGG